MRTLSWLLLVLLCACGDDGPSAPESGPLEISEETTRLLEPRTADGGIDYAAALNAGGAPPAAENAAVPLLRLIGLRRVVGAPQATLDALGVTEEIPAEGVFVPESDEVAELLWDMDEELEADTKPTGKWVTSEDVGDWLAENAPAFELLHEAARRPRYWAPVVVDPRGGLLSVALSPHELSESTYGLLVRAHRATLAGDLDAAWADAQVFFRLYATGRELPGQLSLLVAEGRRSQGMGWLRTALAHAQPTAAQLRAWSAAISALPPTRSPRPDLETIDRYLVLGAFIAQAGGPAEAGVLSPALRSINGLFDEFAELMDGVDAASLAAIEGRVDQLRERIEHLKSTAGKLEMLGTAIKDGDERLIGLIGELLASMAMVVCPLSLERAVRGEINRHIGRVAIALRLHRLEAGRYPEALAGLVPKYLPALPDLEPLGSSFVYRRDEAGCYIGGADEEDEWSVRLPK